MSASEPPLSDALAQIADIRRQMARTEVFRGYKSLTVGFSGLLGLVAAAMQRTCVPDPASDVASYLLLWVGVAVVSVALIVGELVWRVRTTTVRGALREQSGLAAEQFLPCLVVGALLTLCIWQAAPQTAWMLPGLWSLLFGLGVLASYRSMPGEFFGVGLFYIACGCVALVVGQGRGAFSPLLMAVPFGGGQLVSAAILYLRLERS